MQGDMVLHRGNSVIQHGHYNNRVYVMKLAQSDIPDSIRFADELSARQGYSKIFVKVPESSVELFSHHGYVTEAMVPFFFKGEESAAFMAKYRDPDRSVVRNSKVIRDILSTAIKSAESASPSLLPPEHALRQARDTDAEDITALYRAVFKTYPFPVFDPDYIRETMRGSIRYFLIRASDKHLAAVASCEIDADNRCVEMTDFATDPYFRGRGFAGLLLRAMEMSVQKKGCLLAYTIARALSRPINMTFSANGYLYGGLLPNNTNICGRLESMNVWYKGL